MNEQINKGKMTVEEAGRKGGQNTDQAHSPEFYQDMEVEIGGEKGGPTGSKQAQAEAKRYDEIKNRIGG